MSALPVILAVLAGFVACFAISNLVRWRQPNGNRDEGLFGLVCLAFTAYDLLQIGIFATPDVATASTLLRYQGFVTGLLFILFILFGAAFAHRPTRVFDTLAIGCYVGLGLWSLISPAGYWFQAVTAMNPVTILGGRIFHPAGTTATTYYLSIVLQYPLYLSWIVDGRGLVRRGSRIDGTLWMITIGLALLATAHDHLVDFGWLAPPYLAEYPFPVLLLTMGLRFLFRRTQEHTELLAVKTRLADSEAKFRDVFENSSDAIFIHDAETGAVRDVNQTMVEMYGYPKENCETLSPGLLSAPGPEYSPDQALAHLATARQEGQTRFPWKARHRDGTLFPVEVTLKSTRVAGQACVVANVRDLSRQEAALAALTEEQAFTHTLIDSLPGIFYLYDRHLRLRRWNRHTEALLGYPPEQLASKTLGDFYPPGPTRDALVAGVLQWFARPNPPVMRESSLLRADGGLVPCLITATRVETRDGPLLMGVGLDISGLVGAQAALRESEARYHALFENAGAAILLIHDGIIVDANARAVALLADGPADDLIGRATHQIFPPPAPAHPGTDFETAMTATLVGQSQAFEYRLSGRRSGPLLCEIHLQAVPIGGRPHVQAILWDVTEKRQMEERLKLAQRLEAIGYLAGGVAHDFNNLLTPILGNVDLLLAGRAPGDPLGEGLQQIQQAALAARRLTRQLLTVGRRSVLETSTLELAGYLRALAPLFRGLLREDIALQLDLGARDATVHADSTQLEQVLMNLIINARDAIPQAGTITLSLARARFTAEDPRMPPGRPPGDYAVITVADTGVGIDPATREHLFDPFFTTKPTGTGTGLGLATVLGIVEQHQGHVTVDSEPGKGATFRVHLPLVPEAPASPLPAAEAGRPVGGKETILVVEDDDAVRNFTCRSLEKFGYQIYPAASPAIALEVFHRLPAPPDLVLTDVVMPGMSGKELHDRLAVQRPGLRVLYMTGYSGDTVLHHGVLADGAILQKPFTLNQLLAKIREVIDRR